MNRPVFRSGDVFFALAEPMRGKEAGATGPFDPVSTPLPAAFLIDGYFTVFILHAVPSWPF